MVDLSSFGSTVEYNGTVTQNIVNPATIGFTEKGYYNLIISGTGAKTLVGSQLDIAGDFTSNGTLDFSGSTVSFIGTANQTISGTLAFNNLTIDNTVGVSASNNMSIGGDWVNNGSFAGNSSTVNFTGASKSIGGISSTTFYDLSLSGSASLTTGIATIISHNLAIGNGTTLNINGYDFTVTGATTVGGGTTGNLVIGNATGTKTFGGLVTVTSGATWNNSSNSSVTFKGGITKAGTFNAGTGITDIY